MLIIIVAIVTKMYIETSLYHKQIYAADVLSRNLRFYVMCDWYIT